jgi:SIR2-like domain
VSQNDVVIAQLAQRVVEGDFVPFIGAGCSKALLGGNDWPGITRQTAEALDVPLTEDYTGIAQLYEDRFGRDGLIEFLRERLSLTKWNDVGGYAQLALMELRFPAYYTTNIDNVTELCYQTYNQPLDVVVEEADLKRVRAGAARLYKFHGDIAHPDRLVWTERDYDRRLHDEANFMHVLLRADLLRKSIFFIGYSLQDPHLLDLIRIMRERYEDAMRDSVLIAFGAGEDLAKVAESLRVRVISTSALYPERSHVEAFSAFLQELGAAVKAADVQRGLENIFKSNGPGFPVLSEYDLHALEEALPSMEARHRPKAFRATCSSKRVPKDFEDRVAAIYEELCLNASLSDVPDLVGALFTMGHGATTEFYLKLYAAAFTLHRYRNTFIVLKHINDRDDIRAAVAACAAMLMREKGIARNTEFADWLATEPYGQELLEQIQDPSRSQIKAAFEDVFRGSARTNPLKRQATRRLPGTKNYQEMLKTLLDAMPQKPPGRE